MHARPSGEEVQGHSDTELGGKSGWDRLAFKPEKAVFDRNYGTSRDFLATDVTTGNRVAKKEGEKLDEKPCMEVVADAWGLHFRYTVKEPMACAVKAVGDQFDPRNGQRTEVKKFKCLRNRWAPRKSDATDKRPTVFPENKYGEWNRLELVTRGDTATFILNGHVVNVVEELPVTKGRILLQTELHGIEFRNIEIER